MKHTDFIYPPDARKSLKDFDPSFSGKYKSKKGAEKDLQKGIEKLAAIQDMLYAHDR